MKKIINKHVLLALITVWALASACGSRRQDDERESRTNEQILAEVSTVKAIGKVVPASDWAVISSPVNSRIHEILVQEGDTVQSGQILVALESQDAALRVREAQARLAGLEAEHRRIGQDVEKARLVANERQQRYE